MAPTFNQIIVGGFFLGVKSSGAWTSPGLGTSARCRRATLQRAAPSFSAAPLGQDDIEHLRRTHFINLNCFISEKFAAALSTDVEALRTSPEALMSSASAEHGSVSWFELHPKSQPFVVGEQTEARAALISAVDSLRRTIEESSGISLKTELTELKYAYYPFGGRYQKHVDGGIVQENRAREYSFILYLNSHWGEGDGGKLRVFSYEDSDISPQGYVDIAPRAGTAVVFKSDVVPHEVLPTSTKRVAIVGWFHREVESSEDGKLGGELSPLAHAISEHYREQGKPISFG